MSTPRRPRDRTPTRRGFLRGAGALLAGTALAPAGRSQLAESLPAVCRPAPLPQAPEKPRTLVTIFLRGGADALNVIVPYADKTYYDVRPTIAIPAEGGAGSPGVLKLDDAYGLHPAMAALEPFYRSRQLAAVLNVGSPHPTRSHFDAQDFMEYAAPGDRTLKDGWLNRYLQATRQERAAPLRALAMQGLLPRSLRGQEPVLAVPRLKREDSEGLLDLFDDVYKPGMMAGEAEMTGGDPGGAAAGRQEAVEVGRHTIETLRHSWDIVEKEPPGGTRGDYARDGFAERMRAIARVIRNGGGVEVAGVDLTSWDHHQGEGSTDGELQRRLEILSGGLAAFATDLGSDLERVLVLVMSEFGRNVAENGNRGTDHGRGGFMLALGGAVDGGRIFGSYGSLQSKHLLDGRDLQVEIDFRTVFTDVLQGFFGFDPPKGFFPLFARREPLGLVKRA